ncbi:MAG: ROK family protein [Phycisphaerales bacterium]
MLTKRWLYEIDSQISGRGRPRIPLAIDGIAWRTLGLSVRPDGVSCARITPKGEVEMVIPGSEGPTDSRNVVQRAAEMVSQHLDSSVLSIGLCVPGFADYENRRLLLSTVSPGLRGLSLQPIFDVAGDCPIVLDNDMSAVAARWWHHATPKSNKTTLVIQTNDEAIGAAIMINGKPNFGSVLGGAELGHMRFPIETDLCSCGRRGCLARIFSSSHLKRITRNRMVTLEEGLAQFEQGEDDMQPLIEVLGMGISNAVNLVRPHRLVMVTRYADHPRFIKTIEQLIRNDTLDDIADKMKVTIWPKANSDNAIEAAFLALAAVYSEDWRNASRV